MLEKKCSYYYNDAQNRKVRNEFGEILVCFITLFMCTEEEALNTVVNLVPMKFHVIPSFVTNKYLLKIKCIMLEFRKEE